MSGWLLPVGYLAALVLGTAVGVWSGRRHAQARRAVADADEAAARETSRRISGLIRSHRDVPAAFGAAVAAVGQELGCDMVYVQLMRSDEQPATIWRSELKPARGPAAAQAAFLPLPDEILQLLGPERSLVVPDARAHPALQGADMAAALAALDVASLLACPITSPSGVVGAVVASQGCPGGVRPSRGGCRRISAWSLGRALQNRVLQNQQDAVVQRLEALDRSKSDFVASVSHELRTPLTSIAGYVEMLLDGDGGVVTEGQKEMLDIIGRTPAVSRRSSKTC